MKQKSARTIKKAASNVFGSLGYLSCVFQWFWAIMLYFSVIQSFILFVSSASDRQADQAQNSFTFTLPGPVQVAVLVLVTVIMLAVTIYAFVKIPMNIVKTSNKVVHKTATNTVPIILRVQHKTDTKKARAKVASKLVPVIKLALIIIPAGVTVASGLLEKQSIDYSIAVIVGLGLAACSLVFFVIQYSLARLLRVKMSDLW